MADSFSEESASNTQSPAERVCPILPNDGYEYSKLLFEKAASDPFLKIVAEEFHRCMERTKNRLNEISPGLSAHELSEYSKEIRRMVSFCFGNPTARAMTGTVRKPNEWNDFQREEFRRIDAELCTCHLH